MTCGKHVDGHMDIINCRNNCGELSWTELDLAILGMIQSTINCDEVANQDAVLFPQSPNLPENLSFHASSPQDQILQSSLKTLLRTHANKKRLPSYAFSAATIKRVVKFIMNVAEDQALLLPASKILMSNCCRAPWQNLVFGKATKVRVLRTDTNLLDTQSSMVCGPNFAPSLL